MSFFICGDLNSKSREWNCNRSNLAGRILQTERDNGEFFIFHPHEPTHFSSAANTNPSTIDLTLTNGLNEMSDPETHQSTSDHLIVTFEVYLTDEVQLNQRRQIPNYAKADWNKYRDLVNIVLDNDDVQLTDITDTNQIDELITKLTDAIKFAQHRSIPLVTPHRYELILPDFIKDMIRERNRLVRQLQ